jgi:hypothetical protein
VFHQGSRNSAVFKELKLSEGLQLNLVLLQLIPVYAPTGSLILLFFLCLGLREDPLPSSFINKIFYVYPTSAMLVTSPLRLITSDFIKVIIFGAEFKR